MSEYVRVHLSGTMRQPVDMELVERTSEWVSGWVDLGTERVKSRIYFNSIDRVEPLGKQQALADEVAQLAMRFG